MQQFLLPVLMLYMCQVCAVFIVAVGPYSLVQSSILMLQFRFVWLNAGSGKAPRLPGCL